LINIFNKLSTVSPIANLRNWVIIFYNLLKHFSLYVSILPGKNVSTSGSEGVYREQITKIPLISRQLKKSVNGLKSHTGRDAVEIRYPVSHCFLWIPDIHLRRIPE
jgi:hypothetical protein